jgi:hypothetical protein
MEPCGSVYRHFIHHSFITHCPVPFFVFKAARKTVVLRARQTVFHRRARASWPLNRDVLQEMKLMWVRTKISFLSLAAMILFDIALDEYEVPFFDLMKNYSDQIQISGRGTDSSQYLVSMANARGN